MDVIFTMCTRRRRKPKISESNRGGQHKHQQKSIFEKSSSCDKVFAPWRFDGTNYLAKRILAIKLFPGARKRELACDGQAAVAVTEETLIRLEYDCKTNIVKVTFFIQRYTAEDFAVDSTVQAYY